MSQSELDPNEELCAFNIRILPVDLRFSFRTLCSEHRIGMSDALIKLMADAVDKQIIPGVQKPQRKGISMPRLTDSLDRK
jgi:hypothetical protein